MEICNAIQFLWKLFLPLNNSDIGELRCNSLALQSSEDDVTVIHFTTNRLALSVNWSRGGCSSGCLVTSVDKHAFARISHHITHQHYANDFINRWIFKTFSEWNKKADTFICSTSEWQFFCLYYLLTLLFCATTDKTSHFSRLFTVRVNDSFTAWTAKSQNLH